MRDAPLAALIRREPELAEQPVCVVDLAGSHGRVVACTSRATALGVMHGQTAHQARGMVPEAIVRVSDPGALSAARAALADAAASLAARVEPDADRVYVDVEEIRGLYGSEEGFVAAMTEAARRVGLGVDIGIASTKGAARIAASKRVGGAVIPADRTRTFLSLLPLDVLAMTSAMRMEFTRLGMRSVGDIAALPIEATGTRLGPDAARVITLARGEDKTPLFPRPHATRFEESQDLEWEVADVNALVFVLKRLADAMMNRLACRSLAASGATLTLTLLSRAKDERTLQISHPTRDAGTLLHLARASLEASPPADAVTAVRWTAIASAPRPTQLGLFDPPAPAPEKLTLTLARLAALVGADRVGHPVVPDSHRPNAFALGAFEHSVKTPEQGTRAREQAVALHVFRPPRDADVVIANGRMVRVSAGEVRGGVRTCCGPFRVAGEWWGDRFDHDAYDVELNDGGLYLFGLDRITGKWRLEGVYE